MEKSIVRLTKELSQGQDLAKQLQSLLFHSSSPTEMCESLLQSILSCFDRALSSLVQNALSDEPFDLASLGKRHGRDALKRKRKDEGDRTEMVKMEGGQQDEDGYSWRKYGQKRILDSKYPRGYFRCTHRPVQGCLATKLVQRSDNDPSLFRVSYRGRHTCIPPIDTKLDHQDPIVSPSSIPNDAGTTVHMAEENRDTKGTSSDALVVEQGILLDDLDFDLYEGFQYQTTEPELGLAEIFSAPTSVTNSSVVFPLLDLGFDPEVPFDDPEFFS